MPFPSWEFSFRYMKKPCIWPSDHDCITFLLSMWSLYNSSADICWSWLSLLTSSSFLAWLYCFSFVFFLKFVLTTYPSHPKCINQLFICVVIVWFLCWLLLVMLFIVNIKFLPSLIIAYYISFVFFFLNKIKFGLSKNSLDRGIG